jgi:hypothetical protein
MPVIAVAMFALAGPASAQVGLFPCPTAVAGPALAIACPTFQYAITPGATATNPPPRATAGGIFAPFGTNAVNPFGASGTRSVGGLRIANDGGVARSLAPVAAVILGLLAVHFTLMRIVRRRVTALVPA